MLTKGNWESRCVEGRKGEVKAGAAKKMISLLIFKNDSKTGVAETGLQARTRALRYCS
jgi:hypothetical protein